MPWRFHNRAPGALNKDPLWDAGAPHLPLRGGGAPYSSIPFPRFAGERDLKVKLRGIVRFYQRSKLLWERENLVVNTALTALANLLGGQTSGQSVAVIGFGSGSTAPTVSDTALNTNPCYYKAIGTITIGPSGGVAAGSVQFAYSLLTTDYAANPLTIQEMGLFGNTGAASFPAATGTANPSWTNAHAYSVGNLIADSNGNIQRCTTAGTSGGAAPTWATTIGSTTNDNSAVWTLTALHTAPVPMIAHVVMPSFPYTGGGNYSGTWTVNM
jgi:hypothetical protein